VRVLCPVSADHDGLRAEVRFVDILSNTEIRANLPKVSDWPTFPQLFVDGELVGGCDILTDMYQSGELKSLLDDSAAKREGEEAGEA